MEFQVVLNYGWVRWFQMDEQTVFQKIKKADNLPQLPQVMLRLIKACNNEEVSIEELTEIISTDPSLSSRLIQIIGSPYINLPKAVNSIKTAVVYLGLDTIRNIAISTSAMRFFNASKVPEGFDLGRFWYHSYKTGVIARQIAVEKALSDPDEYFLAGLLHDIGRLVLMQTFPEAYTKILADADNETQILEAEKEAFSTNTPMISSWLFGQWNLNPLVGDAVLFVNEDIERIESGLSHVKAIYAANLLAGPVSSGKLDMVSDLLGMRAQGLEQVLAKADRDVDEMVNSMGIKLDEPVEEADEAALTEEIQDLSLFFGTMQNLLNARNIESILEAAQNGLKILFGIQRVFYFLKDDKREMITGFSSPNDKSHKIIKSIALPLSNPSSLLVKCMKEQLVQNSLQGTEKRVEAISDKQIARLLEADGIYCIPIYSSDRASGVMAVGVDKEAAEKLQASQGLVRLFSKQTGVCMDCIRFYDESAQKIHDKKMEAYAELTDRIIHEVNNPVSIIKNYIQTLSFKLPDKHPAQGELSVVSEEMTRVSGLLDKLRNFSQPKIDGFERIDVNKLCQNILELLKKSILMPNQINASINTDPEIPMIKTDPNGLKQVFINLIKNASEAMKDGGEIEISTRFLPESSKIMIDEKKRIPGNIEIIVSDTGPGIDGRLKDSLFDPYTTTKTGPKTSGLGLSIVYSIIKELNGSIDVQSEKGAGTRFIITLPVNSSKKNT